MRYAPAEMATVNKLVTGFRAAEALECMARIEAVHTLLVHLDGSRCEDGCDRPADPLALAVYYGPEGVR